MTTNQSTKTVLIVEDNPGDAGLIREELDQPLRTSWNIECVDRLSEALARLQHDPADVILLDLSLPDAHGFAALTEMNARVENIPIVVLTGQYNEDLGLEALQHGAQDYLVKGSVNGAILSRVMEYAIERKRNEEALRESDRRYRLVVENSRDTISVLELDGQVLYASPSHRTVLGYSPEELVGARFQDFIHPDDQLTAADPLSVSVSGLDERGKATDVRVRHRDGHWVVMEGTATLIQDDHGGSPMILAVSRDVTDQARSRRRMTAQH